MILLQQLISLVIQASLAAIIPLATAALFQWLKKQGIQISIEKQAQLEQWATNATLAAEEWAAQQVKLSNPTPSPEKKLDYALEILFSKAPKLSETDAHDLIHAALPALNLGASSGNS